jgi:acetolactate synthase-1/2/3 large subunit
MRHQRRQALRESDCVVLCGVPCDFRLDYGKHIRSGAVLIAANRSRHDATLNRRPTHLALGDAGLFLQDLQLPPSPREEWIERLRLRDAAREAEIKEQSGKTGSLINPLALLTELEKGLSENSVLVADGGDFVATAAYILKPRSPLSWLDPGAFGTLGVGAGFALGAALCRPGAEIWMILGDGACGYSLSEFDTFVRHGLPVIALVGNDAGWTQIAREQVKILKDDVGTVLARTAYHEVARGFGAQGLLAKSPAEVPLVLSRAREFARQGQPVLVNAWLDKADFREGSLSM